MIGKSVLERNEVKHCSAQTVLFSGLRNNFKRTSAPRCKTQKAKSRGYLNPSASGIHNGDAGIFVTCGRGQEAKCVQEMDDILSEV